MREAENNRELLSALADGQLRGAEFAHTVQWLGETDDARLTWHAYHLVGDVLRSGETMASDRDAAFVRRLKLSLQREAVPTLPFSATDSIAAHAENSGAAGLYEPKRGSANQSRFGWQLAAGLASLAVMSIMAWQVGDWRNQGAAAQLAQVPVQPATQQVASGAQTPIMIRDPRLDSLLAAHRQFGGTSALQMPAGFVRNATFEGAAR